MRVGRICFLVGVSHAEPSSVTRDVVIFNTNEHACLRRRVFTNMQAHTIAQFIYISGLAYISARQDMYTQSHKQSHIQFCVNKSYFSG